VQALSTLEVKDGDLERTVAALETTLAQLDCMPDVEQERALAAAACEGLQARVAAQQALEDTMAAVRGICTSDGAYTHRTHAPAARMPRVTQEHAVQSSRARRCSRWTGRSTVRRCRAQFAPRTRAV
jgi:hypothetical protein